MTIKFGDALPKVSKPNKAYGDWLETLKSEIFCVHFQKDDGRWNFTIVSGIDDAHDELIQLIKLGHDEAHYLYTDIMGNAQKICKTNLNSKPAT